MLVDDGCVPESKALLKELARNPKVKTIIEHSHNLGISQSYNDAITHCAGEYILRAEDDDSCQLDFIEKLVSVLNENPNVGLVFSAYEQINPQNDFIKYSWDVYSDQRHAMLVHSWIRPGDQVFKDLLVHGNFVHGCTQMIRRDCFLNLGEYYPRFQTSADLDFVFRVALNYDIAYLNEPLVYYRKHPSNYSNKANEKTIREYYLLVERALKQAEGKILITNEQKDQALFYRSRLSALHALSFFLEGMHRRALSLIRIAAHYDPKVYRYLWIEVFILIRKRLKKKINMLFADL